MNVDDIEILARHSLLKDVYGFFCEWINSWQSADSKREQNSLHKAGIYPIAAWWYIDNLDNLKIDARSPKMAITTTITTTKTTDHFAPCTCTSMPLMVGKNAVQQRILRTECPKLVIKLVCMTLHCIYNYVYILFQALSSYPDWQWGSWHDSGHLL